MRMCAARWIPARDLVVLTAFLLVLGTLLIQRLTLKALLLALNLHTTAIQWLAKEQLRAAPRPERRRHTLVSRHSGSNDPPPRDRSEGIAMMRSSGRESVSSRLIPLPEILAKIWQRQTQRKGT